MRGFIVGTIVTAIAFYILTRFLPQYVNYDGEIPGLLVIGVVGVLWCLFDKPWRQCWHDKAAHTFVAG